MEVIVAIKFFKTYALFKHDQKARTGNVTGTVWKTLAKFDLHVFTVEEPFKERFDTGRTQQEKLNVKTIKSSMF